jgi:CheY-like chemotaxis protein
MGAEESFCSRPLREIIFTTREQDMSKRIVLVDDNENDCRIITELIREIAPSSKVEVFRDGQSALGFFTGAAREGKVTLVVLDMRLPRASGMELLQVAKSDAATRDIPIVVFSVVDEPASIKRAYSLGANGYVIKPDTPADMKKALSKALEYWLEINANAAAM